MSATQVALPLAAIEGPIAEDNWVGNDPRENGDPGCAYRQARDHRQAARAIERQAAIEGVVPPEALDRWAKVREAAVEVLTEEAKDLEMAACLADALVRTEGLAGLAAGLRVFRELLSKYWGLLYPRPDESYGEGPEETLRPLEDLNTEAFLNALGHVPLTVDFGDGPREFWRYPAALSLQKASDSDRADRLERGAIPLETLQADVQRSGAAFCQGLAADLQECEAQFKQLERTLVETCVDADGITVAPSLSNLGERIEEMAATVRRLAGPLLDASAEPGETNGAATAAASAMGPAGGTAVSTAQSREEAFATLLQVADRLAQLEPQSLLPAMIRKVVAWGRLPPERFYKTIINDSQAREWLFETAGLDLPEDEDN